MAKLYIKHSKPFNSLADVIDKLYKSNHPYASPTYHDKECQIVHCSAERRSFDDLMLVAKTYFPKSTEVDLMAALKKVNIHFYYCDEIHKIVFHFVTNWKTQDLHRDNFTVIDEAYWADGTYTADKLSEIYQQL